MKAIGPGTMAVIFLLIVMSLVGITFLFVLKPPEKQSPTTTVTEQQRQTQLGTDLTIDHVEGNRIYIKNSGDSDVSTQNLNFYANGQKVSALVHAPIIQPGKTIEFVIDSPASDYELKVTEGDKEVGSVVIPVTTTTTTVQTTIDGCRS